MRFNDAWRSLKNWAVDLSLKHSVSAATELKNIKKKRKEGTKVSAEQLETMNMKQKSPQQKSLEQL